MGITLLDPVAPDPLLRRGEHVRFVGEWPKSVLEDENPRFWRIERTQRIRKQNIQVVRNLGGTSTRVWELALNDSNGFLPQGVRTLYEMRMSFTGAALLYVLWPGTTDWPVLERAASRPDLTSDTDRYVSFFDPDDLGTPENDYRERLLRFHTVEDMEPITLRWAAETVETDEKVVVDWLINRCLMFETTDRPPGWREILHYELYTAGWSAPRVAQNGGRSRR